MKNLAPFALVGAAMVLSSCLTEEGSSPTSLLAQQSSDQAEPGGEDEAAAGADAPATAPAAPPPAAAAATPPPAPAPTAAAPREALRFHIAPVVGVTGDNAATLSARLSQSAGRRGLALASSGGEASHVLRGYFSTVDEEDGTVVIYVWDVLDASGTRVHRIQGRELSTGEGGGSRAVSATALEAIADRTMGDLAGWRPTGDG